MRDDLDATAIAAFDEEFRGSLPRISAALEAVDADPTNRAAAQEAYRLIHALKGAASMVGLAAFGHLLHVAEELIEGSIATTAPIAIDALIVLGGSLSHFVDYMDAAMAGRPVEPEALALLRALRQDDGPDARAALDSLLEIEARELASLPFEAADADPIVVEVGAGDTEEPFELAPAAAASPPSAAAEFGLDLLLEDVWPEEPGAPAPKPEPEPEEDSFDFGFAAEDFGHDGLARQAPAIPAVAATPQSARPADAASIAAAVAATIDDVWTSLGDATRIASPEQWMAALSDLSGSLLGGTSPADTSAGQEIAISQAPAPEPAAETPAAAVAEPVPVPDFDLGAPDDVPAELAEIFGQEAQEHLETIARITGRLTAGADDPDAVPELRRAVHTLKGAAGVVGYKGAAKLAHRMEDLLDRLFEGVATLTPRAVRALATSSDALSDLIVGGADQDGLRATIGRLFSEFEALLTGVQASVPPEVLAAAPDLTIGPASGTAEPTAGPTLRSGDDEPVAVAAGSADEPPSIVITPEGKAIVDRRKRADRRGKGEDRRGTGQVLRVPVPRLNELVRVVSELVINRSTFEQHHAALVEQVDELKLATARLKRVTYKLESDYEVRALAGNMATAGAGGGRGSAAGGGYGFDELEFDRYTEFHLLTRELTETTSDIATIGARVATTIGDFDSDLTRLGRLTREVQDKTMEFRMVPLGTMTTQLERAVRATGESCGKLVDFAIAGEHVALDKSLLEQMADPLLHLLRNAVDHGIEPAEARRAAGKPERGRVTVRALHEGTDVLIEVEDDGAGLDVDRIRQTAIAKGFVTEAGARAMAPDAIYALIFEPGFSTAKRITEVSGRGVGMDVVKSKVGRLGGRVHVSSRPGSGTTMSVRVPMTLAITRILIVRSGGQTFGLPLGSVVQIVRPDPSSIGTVGADRVFTHDGRTYPLRDLAAALGLPPTIEAPVAQPVLIANLSQRRIALSVDEIVNSRDAVVKALGSHLRYVRGIWGATLLGDGTVVLILNPADLIADGDEPIVVHAPETRAVAANEPYTVLVVDDSLSMRHVLSQAVKKAGWIPVPARDGVEALEIIHRSPRLPDLVLLDIEMPRMDGYEFLSTIRTQKSRTDLPIVMLTSRSSDKHRDKARALGVTDYMVKPFQEDALVQNIDRLVKAARAAERTP